MTIKMIVRIAVDSDDEDAAVATVTMALETLKAVRTDILRAYVEAVDDDEDEDE